MRKSLLALFIVIVLLFQRYNITARAFLLKALAAIYRAVRLRLERNASLAAACSTGSGEELTRTASSVLACVAAALAALRLVLETALCVKLLLASGEHELPYRIPCILKSCLRTCSFLPLFDCVRWGT